MSFPIVLLLALAGCDFPLTQDDVAISPEGILLHRVVDEPRTKELKKIESDCDATLTAKADFESSLATIAALVPAENARSTTITNWEFNWNGSDGRSAAITAVYEYADYYLQVSLSTSASGQRLTIESVDVQKIVEASLAVEP